MLDESRRDDIGWLVAMYDGLATQGTGEARDADLAQVQRWLCRVTGLSSLSAALAAARRLTRHEIAFIAPVALPISSGEDSLARGGKGEVQERRQSDSRPRSDGSLEAIAPPLNDEVAANLAKLLSELDALPRRARTNVEEAKAEQLRRRIHELTGLSQLKVARAALRGYLKRRDGARRFVPTKPYAEGHARTPPPIRIVLGGSPGGGRRA